VPNGFHLNLAKKIKMNEFYTDRSTVEGELCHYKDHFRCKTVLCNCDDDEYSEFFKYFYQRFDFLGLKKLIGVHYEGEKDKNGKYKPSYKIELYKDTNKDGVVNFNDEIIKTPIYSDGDYPAGDFRSPECIELLKEADIVVTNPPFSLFKDFLLYLVKYKKKFLIIGRTNFYGFKDVFPLLKDNRVWTGRSRPSSSKFYVKNDSFDLQASDNNKITKKGTIITSINGIRWFTNLKTAYKQPPLDMRGVYYTPEKYPKYDNYDAINVDKVADIPCDYPGVMGVPLTFMDKYCPEQFYIEGISNSPETLKDIGIIGEKWITLYRQQGGKGHYSANMKIPVSTINGRAVSHYNRIFIKNKKPENSEQRDRMGQRVVLPKIFVAKLASSVTKKAA